MINMWTLRGTAIVLFCLWLFLDGAVVFRRKTGKSKNRDRFSLLAIMLGNMLAWATGIYLAYTPYGAIRPSLLVQVAGLIIMGIGILVRSIAIAQLGRYHTPNVAVLADHRVVDSGFYHYVRHPSYLGALIAFLGWSLALGNWLSLLIIMGLAVAVYLYRIHEEEAALTAALGEKYRDYCRRTKRLIPGIY
ncbi:MAG: isoprenylcysteine carboxylmethyltransferase family protein [Gammaproteobacteria bacterium]|nr:isoprenylcysteine carboxylmethyltransferase family protein [Gammaproteobacteria bacterium]